jgi:hypothetical protein
MVESLKRLKQIEAGLIRALKRSKDHEYLMSRKYVLASLVLVRELIKLIQEEEYGHE